MKAKGEIEPSMNKLRYLKTQAHISNRDIEKYTGIKNPTISLLENEKRPFRQIHIDKLTSFFNVTTDYLLGRSDIGFIVFPEYGDEELLLSEQEYIDLQKSITVTIISRQPVNATLGGGQEEISINETPYVVYRELKDDVGEADKRAVLIRQFKDLTKSMTTEEIERATKFIEEYILKR